MTYNAKSPTSIAGLLGLLIAAGVAVHFFLSSEIHNQLERAVVEASEAANEDLTQLFINDLYDAIEPSIRLSSNLGAQNDRLDDADYQRIDERIRAFMLGTDFLKIKLYNLKGITLYSSDPNQLGADYSQNQGFISALRGGTFSVSELRAEFGGYSGVVYDRDVISSYVPIRRTVEGSSSGGRIIGIAEIYADRTDEMQAARAAAGELSLIIALGLFLTLVVMTATVWYLSLSLTERYIRTLEEVE